jgi:hypothetical protein
MTIIESYTGFQPLKEVWLGDCYPESFYDSFDNQSQDFFCKITEITKADLSALQKKIEEFGVRVCRPKIDNIELYLDEHNNLIKPPITPRDWALTIGDCLYVLPQYLSGDIPFQEDITRYQNNNQKVIILDRSLPDPFCYINPPAVVRAGKDIYVDSAAPPGSPEFNYFNQIIQELSKNYRVHVTRTGDHTDGVFCPVANKHIFSTHYRKSYEKTFPGWDVFFLTNTTITKQRQQQLGRWWVPGYDYQIFNPTITEKAKSWIGDSRETVFEVNMLVIDEKNVICIAEDDAACRHLEKLGITPHVVNIRTGRFWDGGIHCLTLDIHRQGGQLDYWPNRGLAGAYYYE